MTITKELLLSDGVVDASTLNEADISALLGIISECIETGNVLSEKDKRILERAVYLVKQYKEKSRLNILRGIPGQIVSMPRVST